MPQSESADAVDQTSALRRMGDPQLQRLAQLAAKLCETRAAAIAVVDGAQQRLVASWDVQSPGGPLATTSPPHMAFSASAPILDGDGASIATFIVLDDQPRRLTHDQEQSLRGLGASLGAVLSAHLDAQAASARIAALESEVAELRRHRRDFQLAADLASIGTWSFHFGSEELSWSPGVRRMHDAPSDFVPTIADAMAFYEEAHRDVLAQAVEQAIATGQSYDVELPIVTAAGRKRWIRSIGKIEYAQGEAHRLYGCAQDVTDAVTAREEIRRTASVDGLTGLTNRRATIQGYEALLAAAASEDRTLMLCVMDVDFFKTINDTLGHDVGDKVLESVADLLRDQHRSGDVVGRLGGDEFCVAYPLEHGETDELTAPRRLLAAVRADPFLSGFAPPISLSIGAYRLDSPDTDFATAFKRADLALYQAKRNGRNRVALYESRLGVDAAARDADFSALDAALTGGRIEPRYALRRRLRDNRLVGVEALPHWRDPERGLRGPGSLGCALENPTIGRRIAEAMISSAVRDHARLSQAFGEIGRLAVRVPEALLLEPGCAEHLSDIAFSAGAEMARIEVALTETALTSRQSDAVALSLRALSQAGAAITLDAFGEGPASLAHLLDHRLDAIKVSPRFTRALDADPDARTAAGALMEMGRRLGLATIADGVETPRAAAAARLLGFTAAQGPAMGAPMTAAELEARLRTGGIAAA